MKGLPKALEGNDVDFEDKVVEEEAVLEVEEIELECWQAQKMTITLE